MAVHYITREQVERIDTFRRAKRELEESFLEKSARLATTMKNNYINIESRKRRTVSSQLLVKPEDADVDAEAMEWSKEVLKENTKSCRINQRRLLRELDGNTIWIDEPPASAVPVPSDIAIPLPDAVPALGDVAAPLPDAPAAGLDDENFPMFEEDDDLQGDGL